MDTALVIGYGEVGYALALVLDGEHEVDVYDTRPGFQVPGRRGYDVMHICFPYSETFMRDVVAYKIAYEPKQTVIHSSVPIGTTRLLDASHSPVIGIHPSLEESVRTFTKFIGGPYASQVADHFRRAGIRVYIVDDSETTELMKLMSTTLYGVCIEFTKEVKRLCNEHNVPFEAWTLWTNAYNEGYAKMGRPEYTRPNLTAISTRIGGHCVLPNASMVGSRFADLIKELNGDEQTRLLEEADGGDPNHSSGREEDVGGPSTRA